MSDSSTLKEKLEEGWLHCSLVVEIVGKPAEHVAKALDLLLTKLAKEKKVQLLEEKRHKPKEDKDFFTTFAEVEVAVQDVTTLTALCFDYMPSSIEVIAPDEVKFQATDVSDFLNDFLAQFHQTALRLKNSVLANNLLNNNLYALLKNFIHLLSNGKGVDMGSIAKKTGIREEKLLPLLQQMQQENYLTEKDGKYFVKND